MLGITKKKVIEKANKESRMEEKRTRFKKVASRRTQEILDKLRLLKNCAHTGNYSYTEEDKRKIFTTIGNAWRDVQSEFNKGASKKEKFSFD